MLFPLLKLLLTLLEPLELVVVLALGLRHPHHVVLISYVFAYLQKQSSLFEYVSGSFLKFFVDVGDLNSLRIDWRFLLVNLLGLQLILLLNKFKNFFKDITIVRERIQVDFFRRLFTQWRLFIARLRHRCR